MNIELERRAKQIGLNLLNNEMLRLRLGWEFVRRISGNFEDERVRVAFHGFESFLAGGMARADFDELVQAIQQLASQHPGSQSIDGSQHAAVSATYALAKAMSGDFLQAADYAAYSQVYGYGGYAVTDPAAFDDEFRAQVSIFDLLVAGLDSNIAAKSSIDPI
ncbi:hypothetical protein [Chitinimonas sp.]|uniref:hypothetical protein n=1 Tax=Chitinimonas sp. TaxID=1934313 RepID=UPI0035B3FA85